MGDNEDGSLYMFVIIAADGRHEFEHKLWVGAHKDAAKWHDRDLEQMLESYNDQYGREVWEGMDGQVTRVEMVGAYADLMNGECDDDES
tara:strand:+ start:201 stop:467 length:267 start_codon:yes stop_codon:yes gene_type:complete